MAFALTDIQKRIARLVIITALVSLVAAIGTYGYMQYLLRPQPHALMHVRLNVPSWPGFMIAPLAEELGYMKEEGIKVGFKEYPDKSELNEADILPYDVRGMLAVDLVEEARRIKPLGKVVIITDRSVGGDALLMRPGAPELTSSKQKRITGDDSYPFFFPYVLDLLGGNISTFTSDLSLTQEEVLKKLEEGKVDYAMTYEPYLSMALSKGAVSLFTSQDAPGVVTDTLIFSDRFISAHPDLVGGFTRAYMRAFVYWQAHPDAAYARVGQLFKRKPADFVAQMQKVEMLGLNQNHEAMFSGIGLQSIYGNMRAVQVYENRKGPVVNLNVDALVYPDAVHMLFMGGPAT